MITEDYVSFETAKLLKERGFNEYCEMFYIKPHEGYMQNKKKLDWRNSELRKGMTCTCPTIQMAMKWLREEYGIDIDVCFEILSIHQYANNEKRYSYTIFKTKDNVATRLYGDSGYMKYEDACEAAIKYCLENLIDDKKEDEDDVKKPFATLTNPKTGKWFYAKNYKITRSQVNNSCDVTTVITPRDMDDTIPVIGKCHLNDSDVVSKKDCIGDNEELHIEEFDADGVKQGESFLYNSWIQCVNHETNVIVLKSDYMV